VSCVVTDDCDSPAVVREVSAVVGDVNTTLTGLQPDQMYMIWMTSVSAAASRSDAVYLRLKTRHGGLTGGVIAAIVIAACILAVLTIAAFYSLIRCVFSLLHSKLTTHRHRHGETQRQTQRDSHRWTDMKTDRQILTEICRVRHGVTQSSCWLS